MAVKAKPVLPTEIKGKKIALEVIRPLAKLHKFRKRSCRFASQRLAKRRFQRKLLQN